MPVADTGSPGTDTGSSATDVPLSDTGSPGTDVPVTDTGAPTDSGAGCGALGQACCGTGCSAPGASCCDGLCVDTSASTTHCGACGRECRLANAHASCSGSVCAVATCETGFGDCDAVAANGCEADFSTSAAHCGACDRACPAGQVCASGSCQSSCAAGETQCSGGCVNTGTDVNHCGACGQACNLPRAVETCSAGVCGVARCDEGYGDCDGNAANGCEVPLATTAAHCGACGRACPSGQVCSAGTCQTSCGAGLTLCGTACVNLQTDAAHCGACGRACAPANATGVCAAGACGVARCNTGFGNCDGNAANGCETSTTNTAAHCGACGRACTLANATARCAASACTVASCSAGFGNCDGNGANGCETATSASLTHCGACGRACNLPNANETCTAGACGIGSCTTGMGNCDGNVANGCETNRNTSTAHCGTCGHACAAGQVCSAGVCTTSCPAGQTNCAGSCVNTATDVSHCGACGRACNLPNANEVCAAGACGVGTCAAGFGNCDGNAANGCETNTNTSTAHCGACGRACSLPNTNEVCAAGACGVGTCTAGFGNCDGNAANGCETNTTNTAAHCGACGRACRLANATAACAASACTVASCTTGFGNCDGNAANGCEVDLRTSVSHCGACGRACNLPNANEVCAAGACGVGTCTAGFGNCDGNAANGCETNTTNTAAHCGACGRACPSGQVCSAGACTIACGTGLTLCSGRCVNLQTDAANCGACGRACAPANATGVCAAGACGIARCNTGFGNCDGNAANGCETNTTNTAAHCGACGRACRLANATAACAASVCTVASCTAGFGNCDGNATNGCEVDLRTSVSHCGACGRACNLPNANEVCAASACGVGTCTAGFGNCDGNATNGCETNLTNSTTHCGACGRACAAGQLCASGTCASACGALGQVCCSTAPICTVGDRCSAPRPVDPAVCCNNRNRPCGSHDDCCGQMLCNPATGTCACQVYGAPCATLLDCCGVGSDPYFCDTNTTSPAQPVCCKPPLFPCTGDEQCCGNSRCEGGTCSCLRAGAACTSAECCLPLTCRSDGRCG